MSMNPNDPNFQRLMSELLGPEVQRTLTNAARAAAQAAARDLAQQQRDRTRETLARKGREQFRKMMGLEEPTEGRKPSPSAPQTTPTKEQQTPTSRTGDSFEEDLRNSLRRLALQYGNTAAKKFDSPASPKDTTQPATPEETHPADASPSDENEDILETVDAEVLMNWLMNPSEYSFGEYVQHLTETAEEPDFSTFSSREQYQRAEDFLRSVEDFLRSVEEHPQEKVEPLFKEEDFQREQTQRAQDAAQEAERKRQEVAEKVTSQPTDSRALKTLKAHLQKAFDDCRKASDLHQLQELREHHLGFNSELMNWLNRKDADQESLTFWQSMTRDLSYAFANREYELFFAPGEGKHECVCCVAGGPHNDSPTDYQGKHRSPAAGDSSEEQDCPMSSCEAKAHEFLSTLTEKLGDGFLLMEKYVEDAADTLGILYLEHAEPLVEECLQEARAFLHEAIHGGQDTWRGALYEDQAWDMTDEKLEHFHAQDGNKLFTDLTQEPEDTRKAQPKMSPAEFLSKLVQALSNMESPLDTDYLDLLRARAAQAKRSPKREAPENASRQDLLNTVAQDLRGLQSKFEHDLDTIQQFSGINLLGVPQERTAEQDEAPQEHAEEEEEKEDLQQQVESLKWQIEVLYCRLEAADADCAALAQENEELEQELSEYQRRERDERR